MALNALNKALEPNAITIDGRSDIDGLSFLVDFSSLINFYDGDNSINGNWTPFLLKDPIFLMASITKTPFQKLHALYINTHLQIKKKKGRVKAIAKKTINTINQLFDQLIRILEIIERWTHYMQQSPQTYILKTYVLKEVSNTYSLILWSLLALREELFLAGDKIIPGIKPVNWYTYENYDAKIWKSSKGLEPYWIVLGLKGTVNEKTTPAKIASALKEVGDRIFVFLKSIIKYATVQWENIQTQRTIFPDTMLLRTFNKLMGYYRVQMNTLSQKHLWFYYNDILLQKPLPAVADEVYVCADLTKKDQVYKMAGQTKFLAGQYADKTPIRFESVKNEVLNPAAIVNAYSLTKVPILSNEMEGQDEYEILWHTLHLEKHGTPGILDKNQEGEIAHWPTFGVQDPNFGKQKSMALTFGSPMLFLREGSRYATIFLYFQEDVDCTLFYKAHYSLSTSKGWFPLSKKTKKGKTGVPPLIISTGTKELILTINLGPDAPPIEAFYDNPEGYDTQWPMLKIEFQKFRHLNKPPKINSLKIDLNIQELQIFQLFNDFGALETKKPFQPFGPSPEKDQNFIIGNKEIFSKPVNYLEIALKWDDLPDNFSEYYEQYNGFLNGKYLNSGDAKNLFQFGNTSFKVDFQLLQNGSWKPFDMNLTIARLLPHKENPSIKPPYSLFEEGSTEPMNTRVFASNEIKKVNSIINPNIQNGELLFSDNSTEGFFKMQLVAPPFGFGLSLYPKVVSAVALYNARKISKWYWPFWGPKLVDAPNQPFTPTVGLFTGSYNASVSYCFNGTKSEYPIDCFYSTPFKKSFKVFDHEKGFVQKDIGLGNPCAIKTALPLFPSFPHKGQLYLQIENLVASNELSLYFDLTQVAGIKNGNRKISYSFLGPDGWEESLPLYDDTNNLGCSGTVTLNVPQNVSSSGTIMPSNAFWICLSTKKPLDRYPQTVFLKTNGFKLKRVINEGLPKGANLLLPPNSVTGPQKDIPQIEQLVQPFPSFGGQARENDEHRAQRVSRRLKTKDRLVVTADYFRAVLGAFPQIYYCKIAFSEKKRKTMVYVVPKKASSKEPNAFAPFGSQCLLSQILDYLRSKTSIFTNLAVTNFEFEYVRVRAEVIISRDAEPQGLANIINNRIDIFLAPWITSDQWQIDIGSGVSSEELSSFIKGQKGVSDVRNLTIELRTKKLKNGKMVYGPPQKQIIPSKPNILLAPSMDHSKISYRP